MYHRFKHDIKNNAILRNFQSDFSKEAINYRAWKRGLNEICYFRKISLLVGLNRLTSKKSEIRSILKKFRHEVTQISRVVRMKEKE